ncbi:MAG: hypothetical protein M1817_001428 [Caeruleum heppii]|nr:MAG: hypothetical protein M1817_001428 [Caeruleum heppii]
MTTVAHLQTAAQAVASSVALPDVVLQHRVTDATLMADQGGCMALADKHEKDESMPRKEENRVKSTLSKKKDVSDSDESGKPLQSYGSHSYELFAGGV